MKIQSLPIYEQGTPRWYRDRLGCITGSTVAEIIGRGKLKEFPAKAYTYFHRIASERMIPSAIADDDDNFQAYLDEVNVQTKAMRIGSEREADARALFSELYNVEVLEVGFVPHTTQPYFGSSPDGVVAYPYGDVEACLEIKCPNPATHFNYVANVSDAASLKETEPKYYWQCQSHMAVTDALFVYFISFCPYSEVPLHVVKIKRDDEAIKKILDRVNTAEKYISELVANARKK